MSIGSPLDRLVLIGRELETLRGVITGVNEESSEEVESASHGIIAITTSILTRIQMIVEISFDASKTTVKKIWRRNNDRLLVTQKTLEAFETEKSGERLRYLRMNVSVWIQRLLEKDIPELSGINLQLDRSYFQKHLISPENELLVKIHEENPQTSSGPNESGTSLSSYAQ